MKRSWIIICYILFACLVSAQDRTELEAQRNSIIKAIEQTSELLDVTKDQKEVTLQDFQIVQKQIVNREQLIDNLKVGINDSQQRIKANQNFIDSLSQTFDHMANRYQTLLQSMYIKDKTGIPWSKYLSFSGINTAVEQWLYARQFKQYVYIKKKTIAALSDQIDSENQTLAHAVEQRHLMLQEESNQAKKLEAEKAEKNRILKELSKKESTLKKQLEKQKKERENLNAAIEKVIIAALKSTKDNRPASALTGVFAKDKGALPWPLDNAVVIASFGNRPHPTIKNVMVANNGVDIATAQASSVKAIYNGTVMAVSKVPGYDFMIIIQHGDFYSVYSQISQVRVSGGDTVNSGSVIGTLTKKEDQGYVLHFELWKDKTKLDPEDWLR